MHNLASCFVWVNITCLLKFGEVSHGTQNMIIVKPPRRTHYSLCWCCMWGILLCGLYHLSVIFINCEMNNSFTKTSRCCFKNESSTSKLWSVLLIAMESLLPVVSVSLEQGTISTPTMEITIRLDIYFLQLHYLAGIGRIAP